MSADITLTAIYTYPIKACAALKQMEIAFDACGPAWDRRWMIVDLAGEFYTQRELPSLARIRPAIGNGVLRLTAPGMSPISVPLERARDGTLRVRVWRDTCDAWDEGDEIAAWFSDYLRTDARLVRMTDTYVRRVDPNYAPQPAQTSFSDGFPALIVSEASLEALNQRLVERGCEPIPMTRFRPNLVVTGCDAFAEDGWKTVQIGGITLDIVKPCARCAVTTVDQATGTIPDPAEPLATLNTFRKHNGKVMFAQNAIHHAPGQLRVGDTVRILG
jgi:uncharacterized protein YcbX